MTTRETGIQVLSMEHGLFPEIDPLNSSFRGGRPKLKVILQVDADLASALVRASGVLPRRLREVCPSLDKHDCRGEAREAKPLDADGLGRICGLGRRDDPVDLVHLLEHMVIDLVVEISGSRRCSGVTCALDEPSDRFHVFVECEDVGVGIVALGVARDSLMQFLVSDADPEPYRRQVRLARWIVSQNGNPCSSLEAAEALGVSEVEATRIVDRLVDLGFLKRRRPALNYSGLIYFTREKEFHPGGEEE
jgi:hypothetical protein